jgi:hypothetical protein
MVRTGLCVAAFAALVLPATPVRATEEIWFRSPSGNIHCAIFGGDWTGARCDLVEFTSSFPRPADCDLDWGYAFEVEITGPARLLCAGDTVRNPASVVLDYGQSVTLGGIECTSLKDGVTCVNRNGHGFRVARARQELF